MGESPQMKLQNLVIDRKILEEEERILILKRRVKALKAEERPENCYREQKNPGVIGMKDWVIQLPEGVKVNCIIKHSDGHKYLNVIKKGAQTGDYIVILDG